MFHPYHVYDVLEPSLTNHAYLRLFPVSLIYQLSNKAPIGYPTPISLPISSVGSVILRRPVNLWSTGGDVTFVTVASSVNLRMSYTDLLTITLHGNADHWPQTVGCISSFLSDVTQHDRCTSASAQAIDSSPTLPRYRHVIL